jgi:hypothetical protein
MRPVSAPAVPKKLLGDRIRSEHARQPRILGKPKLYSTKGFAKYHEGNPAVCEFLFDDITPSTIYEATPVILVDGSAIFRSQENW